MNDELKLFIGVNLENDALNDFKELKEKLRMENSNDVIRWAVAYANKRFVFK